MSQKIKYKKKILLIYVVLRKEKSKRILKIVYSFVYIVGGDSCVLDSPVRDSCCHRSSCYYI